MKTEALTEAVQYKGYEIRPGAVLLNGAIEFYGDYPLIGTEADRDAWISAAKDWIDRQPEGVEA